MEVKENMTREEWIKFIVISVIYVILHITKELIKERRKKKEQKMKIEIEMLNGANIEEVAKALLETMMGDDENEKLYSDR